MDNQKHLEKLKVIKKDLNMDWFIIKSENSNDPSKCAYAIFVDTNYYIKYIGEVGPLIRNRKFAIKIKKSDFDKLFKNISSVEKIYKFLEKNIDLDDIGADGIDISMDNIDTTEKKISISYGDEEESESQYGTITIEETTLNTIKNYDCCEEQIGG